MKFSLVLKNLLISTALMIRRELNEIQPSPEEPGL